jgi:hypothetical protein
MKKEILEFRKKVLKYLLKNVDKWEFVEADEHNAKYQFNQDDISIWIANGEDMVRISDNYDGYLGIKVGLDLTKKQQKILWDKAQKDKERSGEKRKIEKTQMRNDLYFKFKGVFGEVKFTGYNDDDWWTKYKPKTVKEDNIEWEIDYDNMVAIYKPNK